MRRVILFSALALSLAACADTVQQQRATEGALLGAAAGAVVGGVATGDAEGIVKGAAIGAAGGAIIGAVASRPGYCYARNEFGERVVVRCPPGY